MKRGWLFLPVLALASCSDGVKMEANGFTQGTTYHVSYYNDGTDLQYQIDSLLLSFDRVLSTYQDNSYISKWNRNEHIPLEQPDLFKALLKRSTEIFESTEGALDITVAPLMSFWFENDWSAEKVDSLQVDSIMKHIGMKAVVLDGDDYAKIDPLIRLDVNAIAQGYSVDVLALYLESLGITNYLVEIGGEVRASGTKSDQQDWIVGIDLPNGENIERALTGSLALSNRSMATSGNYRKFVVINGEKFGHTLNPKIGYPATTDLLSVSVLAEDCMTADAYATAFMVMGFERSKQFLTDQSGLDAVLIYSEGTGTGIWTTPALDGKLTRPEL
jgi:thiamine biosynthesis lipoprotein